LILNEQLESGELIEKLLTGCAIFMAVAVTPPMTKAGAVTKIEGFYLLQKAELHDPVTANKDPLRSWCALRLGAHSFRPSRHRISRPCSSGRSI